MGILKLFNSKLLIILCCLFVLIFLFIIRDNSLWISSSSFRAYWIPNETIESVISYSDDPAWTPVHDRRVLLKSAYADLSQSKELRVLVHKHCWENRGVWCKFHSKFVQNYAISKGRYININTQYGFDCKEDKYEAYFIDCQLPSITGRLAFLWPTEVSIQIPNSNISNPSIRINYVPKSWDLAICVAPLFEWNDTNRLILFLEYYIYQGVDQFIIYNYTSHESIRSILREYEKLGLLTIAQWPSMPVSDQDDPNKSIHYHGQILSMNDCVWRFRNRAKYVGLVDLDEFIVPVDLQYPTIMDILKSHDQQHTGGFMFRSSWAYMDWPKIESNNLKDIFNFNTTTVLRSTHIFPPTERSKVIVKPSAVEKQTVHLVWKYRDSFKRREIEPSIALIYHLRNMKSREWTSVNDSLFKDLLKDVFKFE